MALRLPDRPSLSSLKYQAKKLLKAHHAGDTSACDLLRALHKWESGSDTEILSADLVLADAQHAIALQYGFVNWLALRNHVLSMDSNSEADSELTLTLAQREEFRRRGVINLPGFLSKDLIDPARKLLHDVLEREEVCRQGMWIGERLNGVLDWTVQMSKLLKTLHFSTKRSPEFAAICSAELHNAAEQLMDGRSLITVSRPQVLFTAPNAERWELPHKVWHMDIARVGKIGCPGVQMFTFVDQVDPGGAGTLVAAGSHHYVNDQGKVRSKDVKKQLRKANPWFKGLFKLDGGDRRRYIDEPSRDGDVELQVVELTGAPGDVWLMDLRVLHSLSPNTTDRPRLMATQRYFLPEAIDAVNGDATEGVE